MKTYKKLSLLYLPFFFLFNNCSNNCNTINIRPDSPEETVSELYKSITVEANEAYNWELVRSFFINDPVIVLRTSREGSTIFNMDGFIKDFQDFVERANITESGFVEEIVKMRSLTIGDISNIIVIYEASIPGSDRPPQQGVDIVHLIKTETGWKISSIVNEVPDPGKPLELTLSDVIL